MTAKRALLVIDVQNEYVTGALPIEYPPLSTSLPNIGRAIDAAVAAGLPVILVQHSTPAGFPVFSEGTDGWQLHPEVAVRSDKAAVRFTKTMPSCFVQTGLEEWLRDNGVDTITVVGYMTNNCDQSTVNHGMHLGFDVELLSDATGAVSLKNESGFVDAKTVHESLCVVLQSNFAAVLSTDEWLAVIGHGATAVRRNLLASIVDGKAHAAAG